MSERSNPLGGGVLNHGRLALREMVVAGNTVEGRLGVTGGGGVASTGTLELVRSVVRGNRATSSEGSAGGGGVHNLGAMLIEASTVEGNERTEARPSHGAAGIEHAAGQARRARVDRLRQRRHGHAQRRSRTCSSRTRR